MEKVWNNCVLYNGETHELAGTARELRGIAQKAFAEIESSMCAV